MFIEADAIPNDSIVDTDVCVVGSGAAGISFALQFIDSPLRVLVLESGSKEGTERGRPDPLYDIESKHLQVSNASRRRGFGGTMTIWAGKWKGFDAIDFEKRSWIPLSGWPITFQSLKQYYLRASESVHAPQDIDGPSVKTILDGTVFQPTPFLVQQKKWLQWGEAFSPIFEYSSNVRIHLGAHLTRMVSKRNAVHSVNVRGHGNSYNVRARFFVLAAGGIENARQLLISDIGNEYDQVGRYYMDHPKGRCGIIECYKPVNLSGEWDVRGTHPLFVGFRLRDDVQRRECILNSHIFLEPVYERTLRNKIERRIFGRTSTSLLVVRNDLEQAPVASNRVRLSTNLDPLGLPKAQVEWSVGDLDKKTIVIFHQYLKKSLQEIDIGMLQSPLLESSTPFSITQSAAHAMGTTRMGEDPHSSVVNEECKIYSKCNLFMAGSSVFPTSGYANPTATICALSVRLADHIKTLV